MMDVLFHLTIKILVKLLYEPKTIQSSYYGGLKQSKLKRLFFHPLNLYILGSHMSLKIEYCNGI